MAALHLRASGCLEFPQNLRVLWATQANRDFIR